jgi:phosphatidylglycerol:prolipoprotein diacylglycerol transferase
MRFTAELWRQPDVQLGFLFGGWLTMGQLLSALMMSVAVILWFYFNNKYSKA